LSAGVATNIQGAGENPIGTLACTLNISVESGSQLSLSLDNREPVTVGDLTQS